MGFKPAQLIQLWGENGTNAPAQNIMFFFWVIAVDLEMHVQAEKKGLFILFHMIPIIVLYRYLGFVKMKCMYSFYTWGISWFNK